MSKFKNYPNEMLRLVTLVITLALISSLFGHSEASAGFDDRQGWDVRISTGKKFSFDARAGAGVWINDFGGPSAGYMLTGDFDGDGKTDIAGWNVSVQGWHVALSTGHSFDPSKEGGGFWIEGFGGPDAGFMIVGNFNGIDPDGKNRTDIAGWNDDIKGWHVALSLLCS
ncbi:MAG: hypothetical protein V7641_215 [Blastocatellia bacterium]